MKYCLEESLYRYVGQTITVFTVSGGISGSGFTGVLAHVGNGCVKMISSIGAAPVCAIGSECGGWGRGGNGYYGGGFGYGYGGYGRGECGCGGERRDRRRRECRDERIVEAVPYERSWLGSVTEIPIDKIASFTHHAI